MKVFYFFKFILFTVSLLLFTPTKAQKINACDLEENSMISLDSILEFNYKRCNFDLSAYTYLSMVVENQSNNKVIIDLIYKGNKPQFKNQGRYFLEAKERDTLKLILYRKKLSKESEWGKYFLEARALPGGFVTHWTAFDLSKIKGVVAKVSSNEGKVKAGKVLFGKPKGLQPLEFFNKRFSDEKLPLLDKMGQYANQTWQGKLLHEKELINQGKQDYKTYSKATFSKDRTQYGGFVKGPKFEATGFFYTKKYQGKWWFVDPEGYLFWSQGVTGVGKASATSTNNRKLLFPNFAQEKALNGDLYESSFKNGNIDFYSLNLKKKYGEDWKTNHQKVTTGRLKSWGMNTYGAWSETTKGQNHPYTLIIHPLKQGVGKISKIPDPFSNAFKKSLTQRVNALQKYKNDPWLLGVFVNNELHFGNELSIPLQVVNLKKSTPARIAFEKMLKKKYQNIEVLNKAWSTSFDSFKNVLGIKNRTFPKAFREDLYQYFVLFTTAYFKSVSEELKRVLPNHLYFGSRFHGNVKSNKLIHKVASRYCDVISFNIYEYSVNDFKLYTDIDKPAIIGEFHFGTGSHGVWGVGLRTATDLENQAELYKQYILDAVKHPSFIGAHWFQWSDQPVTGRGGDGENFRIGLVTITDQPYKTMEKAMLDTSKILYDLRTKE